MMYIIYPRATPAAIHRCTSNVRFMAFGPNSHIAVRIIRLLLRTMIIIFFFVSKSVFYSTGFEICRTIRTMTDEKFIHQNKINKIIDRSDGL